MRAETHDEDATPDAELVRQAARGEQAAFAALYRKYAARAKRTAAAVSGNAEDRADAVAEAFADVFRIVRAGRFPARADFWPYLATATKRAAIDELRRTARTVPDGGLDRRDGPATTTRPSERVVAVESAELVGRAFRGLPAHLRTVLEMTEVEGLPAREAAARLGITPNAAAQRALRARARLRQRYLQAHLAPAAEPGCRTTVERLGSYVSGGLASRDLRRVEDHLAECETCRHRVIDLRDIGTVLRRAARRPPPDAGH